LQEAVFEDAWDEADLNDIEPFTIIHYCHAGLTRYSWDGNHKHAIPCNGQIPWLWSSATLYGSPTRERRLQIFREWVDTVKKNSFLQVETELLHFLHNAMPTEINDRFVMNRGKLGTISITTVQVCRAACTMNYYDLQSHTHSAVTLGYPESLTVDASS
jgi:hypothetical protein